MILVDLTRLFVCTHFHTTLPFRTLLSICKFWTSWDAWLLHFFLMPHAGRLSGILKMPTVFFKLRLLGQGKSINGHFKEEWLKIQCKIGLLYIQIPLSIFPIIYISNKYMNLSQISSAYSLRLHAHS